MTLVCWAFRGLQAVSRPPCTSLPPAIPLDCLDCASMNIQVVGKPEASSLLDTFFPPAYRQWLGPLLSACLSNPRECLVAGLLRLALVAFFVVAVGVGVLVVRHVMRPPRMRLTKTVVVTMVTPDK